MGTQEQLSELRDRHLAGRLPEGVLVVAGNVELVGDAPGPRIDGQGFGQVFQTTTALMGDRASLPAAATGSCSTTRVGDSMIAEMFLDSGEEELPLFWYDATSTDDGAEDSVLATIATGINHFLNGQDLDRSQEFGRRLQDYVIATSRTQPQQLGGQALTHPPLHEDN